MEQWKPVVGFEDYYEVSDLGRVKGLPRTTQFGSRTKTHPERILKPWQLPDKRCFGRHVAVTLSVDGVKKRRPVHQLVLETFVGLRPPGMQTRHLNGIPNDNRLVNLQWGTPLENSADAHRHGTRMKGERQWQAKLRKADILAIRAACAAGVRVVDLSHQYAVRHTTIIKIRDRQRWAHV